MRWKGLCLLGLWALVCPAGKALGEANGLKRTVVKIFTVTNRPNYYQPWERGYQYNSSGSGCVLPGKLVLTNAHVVSDQAFLQVMKAGDTKKYTAKLAYVDHDREVALLRVADEAFFEGTVPVELGPTPAQRDKVAVYGFPVGGDELSITEGVVSRVEVQIYTHSQRAFLTLQTDAAINPGNSGGPAFRGGKMMGIAFQAYSGGGVQNTGYIVPVEIIQRSLEDWKSGLLEAPPNLGIHWQKMESPSLRAFYGMKKDLSGVLVTKVVFGSPAWGVLKAEDVLLSLQGQGIADNGTVLFRNDERLLFSHVIGQCRSGQKVRAEVLRDGKVQVLSMTLRPYEPLVAGPEYDIRPTYFIAGGLVFMPLSYNYLSLFKNNTAPVELQDYYENGTASEARRRVIFVNEVLPHEINVGYHELKQAVVAKVNGKDISRMEDVIEAFRNPTGKYHVVQLEKSPEGEDSFGNRIVLEAKGFEEASEAILKAFGITQDRSEDLGGDGKAKE